MRSGCSSLLDLSRAKLLGCERGVRGATQSFPLGPPSGSPDARTRRFKLCGVGRCNCSTGPMKILKLFCIDWGRICCIFSSLPASRRGGPLGDARRRPAKRSGVLPWVDFSNRNEMFGRMKIGRVRAPELCVFTSPYLDKSLRVKGTNIFLFSFPYEKRKKKKCWFPYPCRVGEMPQSILKLPERS